MSLFYLHSLVSYTLEGSADVEDDYTLSVLDASQGSITNGLISFEADQTKVAVNVVAKADGIVEGLEVIQLSLAVIDDGECEDAEEVGLVITIAITSSFSSEPVIALIEDNEMPKVSLFLLLMRVVIYLNPRHFVVRHGHYLLYRMQVLLNLCWQKMVIIAALDASFSEEPAIAFIEDDDARFVSIQPPSSPVIYEEPSLDCGSFWSMTSTTGMTPSSFSVEEEEGVFHTVSSDDVFAQSSSEYF